jgi:hypothetical protein
MKKAITKKTSLLTTLPIPKCIDAGIGKRFRIFLEVSRRPDGITVADLASLFNMSKHNLWYLISPLRQKELLITEYETRNAHVEMVCRVTPFGIDHIRKELRCATDMLDAITMEKIKELKK